MNIFIIWMASIVMGVLIGAGKGRMFTGLALAFFLGPIGVLITLCLPNEVKERQRVQNLSMQQRQIDLQRAELQELRELRKRLDGRAIEAPAEDAPGDFVPENMKVRHRPVDLRDLKR